MSNLNVSKLFDQSSQTITPCLAYAADPRSPVNPHLSRIARHVLYVGDLLCPCVRILALVNSARKHPQELVSPR
jgi:hypothetical protein